MQRSNEITQLKALDNVCHRCRLRNLCSVSSLSASERKRFSDITIHYEKWNRGQHLFFPGDRLRFVYIVHSGSLKTYITSIKGDEQVTGFYFAGDVLSLSAYNHAIQNYGAAALETATVCKIPLAEFEKMMSQYPAFSHVFLKIISSEIKLTQSMLLVLGKMNGEQKVANFLLYLSTVNESRGYSSVKLNLSMLRSDIASYLGIAMETVCRTFKYFQDEGTISVKRNQLTIEDFEALESFIQCKESNTNMKSVAISKKVKVQR